jgi:hydrogenase maturation protein HypF
MAETSSLKAFRVLVKGTVQGVGFRPFVYRLATRLGMTGYVRNVGQGVEIFLEGSRENFEKFLHGLREELPPLARLERLEWLEARPENHQKFSIDRSRQEEAFVFISPDIATCSECLKEIETPGERRYGYPFTNCTNCGPRYTIVKALPYDRASTTMADFPMCPDCQREYEDPSDRRYHAQPIACPVCGPAIVILEARTRKPVSRELSTAAELIKKGKILAVKGRRSKPGSGAKNPENQKSPGKASGSDG